MQLKYCSKIWEIEINHATTLCFYSIFLIRLPSSFIFFLFVVLFEKKGRVEHRHSDSVTFFSFSLHFLLSVILNKGGRSFESLSAAG